MLVLKASLREENGIVVILTVRIERIIKMNKIGRAEITTPAQPSRLYGSNESIGVLSLVARAKQICRVYCGTIDNIQIDGAAHQVLRFAGGRHDDAGWRAPRGERSD